MTGLRKPTITTLKCSNWKNLVIDLEVISLGRAFFMKKTFVISALFAFGVASIASAGTEWCLVHDINGKKMGCYSTKSVCEQVKPKQYWSCVPS